MGRILTTGALTAAALATALGFAFSGCSPQFSDHLCDSNADCFPDEVCVDGECQPAPDNQNQNQNQNQGELNVCGGTEELTNEPGDPCGPCDLDQYQCVGEELVCDGETPCPELDIVTTLPTNIEATSAMFNARIEEFPLEPLQEVGFCWSSEETATLQADCQALDETPTETGSFSLFVEGLAPGTGYSVIAYSLVGEEETGVEANAVEFVTLAPRVTGVDATGAVDAIELSWDRADGATGYEIYADGELLETITDGDVVAFSDTSAPAGALAAPQNVNATDSRTDGVRITWNAAQADAGSTVSYSLVALYPDASSEPSDEVSASRTGPTPTGYQLRIGESTDWIDLGLVLEYLDTDAPLGTLNPGTASASKGVSPTTVQLSIAVPSVGAPAEQTYQVRAVYAGGETDPSTEATGQRGVGSITYQWQRTTTEADVEGEFEDLAGATTRLWNDETAPQDGSIRFYRVRVSAAGAASAYSASDYGFVATAGAVSGLVVDEVGQNEARFQAQLDDVGSPAATEHGFCYGPSSEPSFPAAGDVVCVLLGTPDVDQPAMITTVETLDADSTYYVRAFVHSSVAGTAYSAETSFTTWPLPLAAPEQFAASDDDPAQINLSWDAVAGAEGYVIHRNGEFLAEIDDATITTFVDDGVAGAEFVISNLEASDETEEDFVALTGDAVTADDGPVTTYTIYTIDQYQRLSETAAEASGFRPFTTAEVVWQYHDGDEAWATLAPVTLASVDHDDFDADADGAWRFYRLVVINTGAPDTETVSDTVQGRRAVPDNGGDNGDNGGDNGDNGDD